MRLQLHKGRKEGSEIKIGLPLRCGKRGGGGKEGGDVRVDIIASLRTRQADACRGCIVGIMSACCGCPCPPCLPPCPHCFTAYGSAHTNACDVVRLARRTIVMVGVNLCRLSLGVISAVAVTDTQHPHYPLYIVWIPARSSGSAPVLCSGPTLPCQSWYCTLGEFGYSYWVWGRIAPKETLNYSRVSARK